MATYIFKIPFTLHPHFARTAANFHPVEFAIPALLPTVPLPLLTGRLEIGPAASSQFEYVPKPVGKHVLYLRHSNRPRSKLSLEQQRTDAAALMSRGRARIVQEFIEEEPLTGGKRPALDAAIAYCKEHKTRLVIGRINRIRGCFRLIERLHMERIYFTGADTPYIYSQSYYRLLPIDWDRARKASKAIKAALAQSKAEGTVLGGKRQNAEGLKLGPAASAVARSKKAKSRSQNTMQAIELLRHRGITSLTGIATRLNQMKHPAPRGGQWSPAQVRTVIKRCEG
jgi:hypothetical protein